MANYTKVKIEKGSEYDALSIWKHKYDKPANLMAQSMVFEINAEDIKPGKYRISVWKNANMKSDKSPSGSISLDRVEEDDDADTTETGGGDFNF